MPGDVYHDFQPLAGSRSGGRAGELTDGWSRSGGDESRSPLEVGSLLVVGDEGGTPLVVGPGTDDLAVR